MNTIEVGYSLIVSIYLYIYILFCIAMTTVYLMYLLEIDKLYFWDKNKAK